MHRVGVTTETTKYKIRHSYQRSGLLSEQTGYVEKKGKVSL